MLNMTFKFIGIIFRVRPIILLSRMTVTHKLFKILSGHGFCIKCYCDLDLGPSDLQIYWGHLLTMTNLPSQYHVTQKLFKILCGHDVAKGWTDRR